jgi:diacylglycerol kinase (ATP)
MKVTLIHNPKAGDDSQPSAGQLVALIREAGHKVRLQSTREKGWARTLKKKAGLVAVAGGDGTVGKVCRRLVGSGVPVAVLPLGTANNISRTLGVAGMNIFQLIAGWRKGELLKFDAGVATGPWGKRYFIESVGAGLFARAMPEMDRSKTLENITDAEVKVTYALQMLRERLEKQKPLTLKAKLDGRDISGRYLLVEAMNTRHIGPNLYLAPHVAHDGGMLDLVMISEKNRRRFAKYLETWQSGKEWPHELGVGRGRRLEIEWTGFPLHLDDKAWPEEGGPSPKPPAPIRIELKRGGLRFLVPRREPEVVVRARRKAKN